jgi:cell shape-determining protein MreC
MVTAKKNPAKQTTKASVQPTRKTSVQPREEEFRMPTEVKDWIDQAMSRIRHLTHENERLKEDNLKLRRANKVMEQRVMNMSVE